MRTAVITFLLLLTLTAQGFEVCESYLNRDHERHFEHSKILQLSADEIPLDTIFYDSNGTPIIFQNPFIWLIKDKNNKSVGALIGTVHKYVAIDMMPKKFFDVLAHASVVMTEHSSRENGNLESKLIRPNIKEDSVYHQISSPEAYRINTEWINFNRVKLEVSRRLNFKTFYPKNDLNIMQLSTYGFFMRLSDVAEIASSELRTQPIQMDDKIGRLAQGHGARWQYLEDGPEHLLQYAHGHKLDQIKEILSKNENIFEAEYFQHRKLLQNYKDGNLQALNDFIDTLSPHEHEFKLRLRNRSWIPRITSNLQSQNFTVIAAGIYHFVGEDNLLQLLETQGYKAERLQIK